MEEKPETETHRDSFLPMRRPGLSQVPQSEHKRTQTLSPLLCVAPTVLTFNIVNEIFQGQVQLATILHELSYTILPSFTSREDKYVTAIIRSQKILKFKNIEYLLGTN